MWLASLLVILSSPGSFGQFVSPPTDLIKARGHAGVSVRYKQVPTGICEESARVKSFAGYADVSSKDDQHIFWWFFEARNDPDNAPLTIWINGGPGYIRLNILPGMIAYQVPDLPR
jgi:hypothetical protein